MMTEEITETFYSGRCPKMLIRISHHTQKLLEMAKNKTAKAELIGGFKSVTMISDEMFGDVCSLFIIGSVKKSEDRPKVSVNDLLATLNMTQGVYKEAYQIQ